MITQLPETEWRTTVQNHGDSQKNMRTITRGDHILVTIERTDVMRIMVQESKPCFFTAVKCDECNIGMLFQN